jgi:lipopolysaccharide biosynthesis glycosyltransferase
MHPTLLKSWAPLEHPAEVMVLLDADVLVVTRLDQLFEHARDRRVVAFRDSLDRHHDD